MMRLSRLIIYKEIFFFNFGVYVYINRINI